MCLLFPLMAKAQTPSVNDVYSKEVFIDSNNNTMLYRLLAPSKVKADTKYPLVIFLHGSGERGSDNEKQLIHGGSVFSNPANSDKFPAFVIFPQCKEKAWTNNIDASIFMPGSPIPPESKTEKTLIDLVENVIDNYPIDSSRIYIIGISMGGIATYDLVCRYPELFTAAVPICGAINPDRLNTVQNVKFMIFHGEEDDKIPAICSREAYKTLSKSGAEVEYIEFSGIGHECWSSAFNYPEFLSWLFSQKKDNTEVVPNDNLTYEIP